MRDLLILVVHLTTTVFRLARPGGRRAVVAESVLTKHQMLILNRSRRRAPNLRIQDRLIAGFCSLWIKPSRLRRVALAFKTSTLLSFHRALVQRKYRLLFSPKQRTKPGPKGPEADLVRAVVEMKKRNSTWGCPQIADQINLAFGTSINKDVVRRILALHYQPAPNADGPSCLTFLGHTKDSLWSLDLFCCESMMLRTHWVIVVMDHHTRRIIGFGIHVGVVNGEALCRMFKHAIRGVTTGPRYLSSDHDPLYRFHPWEANLRILGVTEIKTVPYVPWSHPFIERLIGSFVMHNKSPNQSLHKRMRQWDVRHRFEFLHLEDTQIGLPLMEPIQRIVIGTEIFRQWLHVNCSIEHPAQSHAIHNTTVHPKTDNPSRELIHHHQNPVRL